MELKLHFKELLKVEGFTEEKRMIIQEEAERAKAFVLITMDKRGDGSIFYHGFSMQVLALAIETMLYKNPKLVEILLRRSHVKMLLEELVQSMEEAEKSKGELII